MANNLWRFTDSLGTFESKKANKIRTLYFPLANDRIMSSVSPDLHGDIKAGQESFLLTPASRIDLVNLRSSRNFWITAGGTKSWSVTGVSKDLRQIQSDDVTLRAGLLWHETKRRNKTLGLEASVLSFVPVGNYPLELMRVTITNISSRAVPIIPTAAIPIYGRGANNLRDHRHVTSLLQRPAIHRFGVTTKPTLSFDESGHKPNNTIYFVLGWDDDRNGPECVYPTEEVFCGDGGDLEAPESIINNTIPRKGHIEGEEPMGGLRFRRVLLKPGDSAFYTIVMGVGANSAEIEKAIADFGDPVSVQTAFMKTRCYWVEASEKITVDTGDPDFDRWFRWVAIQPTLRKIYGCSFLPDFDYGKGGRGWRDLWQDCLGLILGGPEEVRSTLINNFSGVRIDGSNATIIGKNPGEFFSDRNNISRVWMDHGIWPLMTLELYLDESGDTDVLFEKIPYFRNHEVDRARRVDPSWRPLSCGQNLRMRSGGIYKGTVLEHLLVQSLVQFLNVGDHNHIRLEGADWNDGLDMAKERGESVAFSCMYGRNLAKLAEIIEKTLERTVEVAEEIGILLEKVDNDSVRAKKKLLEKYFVKTRQSVSGKTVAIDAHRLAANLREKSSWIMEHVRASEWLKEGFFNGYYDNEGNRVEGRSGSHVRMMLGSQVFPIMSGTAQRRHIEKMLKSIDRYLRDKKLNGFRLNTDFKSEQHQLGRAFSFIYGDKENGAFFNHMVVMFAYALYSRGYVNEGWAALRSIYDMAEDTSRSKVYPCLPEYFNLEGRGMYTYLTGSASWFVLTLLTQVFGVKGSDGDLVIEPKLCADMFKSSRHISIERTFAGRRLKIRFINPGKKGWGAYAVRGVRLNGNSLQTGKSGRFVLPRAVIKRLPVNKKSVIDIVLG